MEHIIQFGVSVDDEKIEQAVVESAAREVEKVFKEQRGYYSRNGIDAREVIEGCVNKKLDEWKEDIILEAGKQLCDSLKRTKLVKETVVKMINEGV